MRFRLAFMLLALSLAAAAAAAPAKPGDNLQNAWNAGNIELADGTYSISATLKPPSGRTMSGSPRAVIKATGAFTAIDLSGTSDVTLKGFAIEGGDIGVRCEATARPKLLGLEFRNQSGATTACIYGRDVVAGQFNDLYLHDLAPGGWCNTAIFLYGCTEGTEFLRGSYNAVHEGIHIWWYGNGKTPQRTRVSYNIFTNTGRYPIELQGAANDLIVDFNWMDRWPLGTGKMGISCATGGDPSNPQGTLGDNIWVQDNTIGATGLGPAATGGNASQFSAIEWMGGSGGVRRNVVFEWGYGVIYGFTKPGWVVDGNTFVGTRNITGAEWSGPAAPAVTNSTIKPAGSIPVPPPPTTQPATQPIDPTNPISNVVALASTASVKLTWTGGVAVVDRFTANGAHDDTFPAVPAATSPYTDVKFSPAQIANTWHFFYTVNGDANKSNLIQIGIPTTQPIDPPPPGNGIVVTQEAELDNTGKVIRQTATTKPRTVSH